MLKQTSPLSHILGTTFEGDKKILYAYYGIKGNKKSFVLVLGKKLLELDPLVMCIYMML